MLNQTGDAALMWWRIRHSLLATTAIGQQLNEGYKLLRLASLIHEREIKHIVSLLRAEKIEPVLVKGWAIARFYPEKALRPYGDIDLCVRPDQFEQTTAALKCLENIDGHYVDLHSGFAKLTSESWNELLGRSQLVDLGEEKIRVLSDEDHLRVLCLHLLRSGAWRPLWLCDVALAVESRTPAFDWERCLGIDRRQANWVACTIALAHHLLGVKIDDTPIAERAKHLPHWLVSAALRQWSRCRNPDAVGMALPTLRKNIAAPKRFFSEIYARWDNPVRSTAALRRQFNNWPRLPHQFVDNIIRARAEVPKQLISIYRDSFRQRSVNDVRRVTSTDLGSPTSEF